MCSVSSPWCRRHRFDSSASSPRPPPHQPSRCCRGTRVRCLQTQLCGLCLCVSVSLFLYVSVCVSVSVLTLLAESPRVPLGAAAGEGRHTPPSVLAGGVAGRSLAPGTWTRTRHGDCEQSAAARPTRVSPLTRAHVWPDARAAVAAVRRAHGARAVRPRPPAATPTAPPSCTAQTREIK